MLSNKQIVEIMKSTINTALGGQVSADQVREFIHLAVDNNKVLKNIRVEDDIVKSLELFPIETDTYMMVGASEATEPDAADVQTPSISKKTLSPTEVMLPYDISFDMLRKNIRGESLNEDLNKIFSMVFARNVVAAIFRGDTDIAETTRKAKALKVVDGFVAQATDDSDVHDYTISGSDYLGTVFPAMLKLMPAEYRDRREDLAFFVSADVEDDYVDEIGARKTALADQVLFGQGKAPFYKYKKIDIIPVPGMNHDDSEYIVLTLKQNLCAGFGQYMELGKDIYNRARKVEVTQTSEIDCKMISGDATVLGSPAQDKFKIAI